MKRASIVAWGMWAAVVAWSPAARTQPAAPQLDGESFDRCSASSDAVRLLARQSRYQGSEGFDARACPPGFSAEELVERPASSDGWHGLALRGGPGLAIYAGTGGDSPIYTPSFFMSARDLARGWKATASYMADVLPYAPPDVVSAASPTDVTVRHLVTLAASAPLGGVRLGLDGGLSVEDGLVGPTAGASMSVDLYEKRITPMLAYHFGGDLRPKRTEAFNVSRAEFFTHTFDAGVSARIDPATVLVFVSTTSFMHGQMANPFEHVPMFEADVAPRIERGASLEEVSEARYAAAPLARVPESRVRLALLARLARRFESATLRLDERLYIDTWGLKSSTTDVRSWHDVARTLVIGPHIRFHVQSGVDSWQRAYVVTMTEQGLDVPDFRTGARNLGPLFAGTAGGGLRWEISGMFALNLLAEGTYTQFLDALYITERWGVFSAATLELRLE